MNGNLSLRNFETLFLAGHINISPKVLTYILFVCIMISKDTYSVYVYNNSNIIHLLIALEKEFAMNLSSFYPVIATDKLQESRDFYTTYFPFTLTFEADWYVSLITTQSPA